MRTLEAKAAKDSAEGPSKWINRQRTLVLSSRGISFRARHLLTDVRTTATDHVSQ